MFILEVFMVKIFDKFRVIAIGHHTGLDAGLDGKIWTAFKIDFSQSNCEFGSSQSL